MALAIGRSSNLVGESVGPVCPTVCGTKKLSPDLTKPLWMDEDVQQEGVEQE